MKQKFFIRTLTLLWYLRHIPTYLRVRRVRYDMVNSEDGHKADMPQREYLHE